MPQHCRPFTQAVFTWLRSSTSSVSRPICGLVVLHVAGREQHGLVAVGPRRRRGRSARPSFSKVVGAKSGSSLSLWIPSAACMKTRCSVDAVHHVREAEARARQARPPRRGSRACGRAAGCRAPSRAAPCSGGRASGSRTGTRAPRAACRGTAPRTACTGSRRPSRGRSRAPVMPRDVAVVLLVDQVEQDREAVAVLEAHAAAVAELEAARHLLLERAPRPSTGLARGRTRAPRSAGTRSACRGVAHGRRRGACGDGRPRAAAPWPPAARRRV